MVEIDWEPLKKYPEQEIECQCGAIYRSHCKGAPLEGRFVLFTEKACPGCEADRGHVRRASSEPESWVLG